MPSNPDTNAVTSVSGKTGVVTLDKSDVGLGNVDKTADANKSVLYAATAGAAHASDVYSWAKAENKPTYTKSEVGLGNVTNDAQVKRTEMGVAEGVATLTSAGKVPASQLPSFVDDIIEGYLDGVHFYTDSAHTTIVTDETGASTDQLGGKIYVDLASNKTYRWSGSAYTQISSDIAIGTITGTAADGGIVNTHVNDTNNPHSVTKAQVGLGNVTNDAQVKRTEMGVANGVATLDDNGKVPSSQLAADLSNYINKVNVGNTEYTPSDGTVSLPAYPTTLPASDVYSWAKEENKPSYTLSEVGAAASVVALTADVNSTCSITGVGNAGKMETIVYTNSSGSSKTVTIPNTYSTPSGAAIVLTVPDGGYCEVNYLNISGTIYARGV